MVEDFNSEVKTGLKVTQLRKENKSLKAENQKLKTQIEELEQELRAWISETEREAME